MPHLPHIPCALTSCHSSAKLALSCYQHWPYNTIPSSPPPYPPCPTQVRAGRQRSGEVPRRLRQYHDRGDQLLEEVTEYGINATNHLITVQEPSLYTNGYETKPSIIPAMLLLLHDNKCADIGKILLNQAMWLVGARK